jgi:hypothetical protein
MRLSVKQVVTFSQGLVVVALIIVAMGGLSASAAPDLFVGTATATAPEFPGLVITFNFNVDVQPGNVTWEWRFRNVQVESGVLSASVNGSTVSGTLSILGGAATQSGLCCRPCNFTGVISGNQVDGRFDEVSCGGSGTFHLVRL